MNKIITALLVSLFATGVVYAQKYKLIYLESAQAPLIGPAHRDAAGNKNGFEGGAAFRHSDGYHLLVTEEMTGWVQTRTGHWVSKNGLDWKRAATLQESVADSNNARHSIWSPMPVYNDHEQRWNIFYVGYEAAGTIHGRVFRAVSDRRGPGGLGGPYHDVPGTVMAYTDSVRNGWEGVQGTDSFYPFRAGSGWLAFYGSSDAASYWHVGLAEADSLEGNWKRIMSPPVFSKAENPIVVQLEDGHYFAVYDDLTHLAGNNRIGYAWSADGRHWQSAYLAIPLPSWTTHIRTPQGLIPAGNNTYWIYFTGSTPAHFDVVGRVRVRLDKF